MQYRRREKPAIIACITEDQVPEAMIPPGIEVIRLKCESCGTRIIKSAMADAAIPSGIPIKNLCMDCAQSWTADQTVIVLPGNEQQAQERATIEKHRKDMEGRQ